MKKPLAVAAATLAVTLSLGLAACGGSDDSGDSEALSNADLIAQADEICTTYDDKLDTLLEGANLDEKSDQSEVVSFISDEIVPLYQEQIDELRQLTPNEDDADAYNDMLDTLDSELQTVEDDPEASLDASDPFSESAKKANEFGLESCGSN